MKIERIGEARYELGESPIWDPVDGVLYFVDSPAHAIFRYDPRSGDIRRWEVAGGYLGALALRAGGGAVLAMNDGFHAFDFATGVATAIAEPEAGQDELCFNDAKVDRQGRFIAGSMHTGVSEPVGALYRLDTDLACTRLDGGYICSNGPCWSPRRRHPLRLRLQRRHDLRLRLRHRDGRCHQPPHLPFDRRVGRLSGRRHGGRRGPCLERPVQRRKHPPNRQRRRRRAGRRVACPVGRQPDLRRRRSRRALRHHHRRRGPGRARPVAPGRRPVRDSRARREGACPSPASKADGRTGHGHRTHRRSGLRPGRGAGLGRGGRRALFR